MLSDSFTPNDFIDLNTYCYHMAQGQMRLKGVVLGLGWENRPLTPGKLSCYHKKGENKMARPKREAPLKAKLLALFEEHEGKIAPIATELKASWGHTKRWLVDAGIISEDYVYQPKQTPTLEPDQAANQEPDEGEGESATDSISYSVERLENIGKDIPPVKMPIGCSLPIDDSTEPRDEVMAESDTGLKSGIAIQLLLDAEETANRQMLLNLSPTEKKLLEDILNAYFLVKRVLNNPVALAQMKQVLGSGVI